MKRLLMTMVMVGGLLVAMAQVSEAAYAWYTCRVAQAGFSGTYVMLELVDAGDNPAWAGKKWFYINGSNANRVLSMSLTAISLDKEVRIYTDLQRKSKYPYLKNFYVVNE